MDTKFKKYLEVKPMARKEDLHYDINDYKEGLERLKKKYEKDLLKVNQLLDDFNNNKFIYFVDSSAFNFHRGYVDAKGNEYRLYEKDNNLYLIDNKTNEIYDIIEFTDISKFSYKSICGLYDTKYVKYAVEVKKIDMVYKEPTKEELEYEKNVNQFFGNMFMLS